MYKTIKAYVFAFFFSLCLITPSLADDSGIPDRMEELRSTRVVEEEVWFKQSPKGQITASMGCYNLAAAKEWIVLSKEIVAGNQSEDVVGGINRLVAEECWLSPGLRLPVLWFSQPMMEDGPCSKWDVFAVMDQGSDWYFTVKHIRKECQDG